MSGGMIVRTPMSSRPIRWLASESNPASAAATRTSARRQASNSRGSKCGWSLPIPVVARAARIRWHDAATAIDSLGSRRTARDRRRSPAFFAFVFVFAFAFAFAPAAFFAGFTHFF